MNSSLHLGTQRRAAIAGLDAAGVRFACREAVRKLAPRHAIKSPVMAIVLLGTLICALITATGHAPLGYGLAVTVILLITVLFGNFAEAVAEARGRGQAAALRAARKDLVARKLDENDNETRIPASDLRRGDRVIVSAGELVPADGEIIKGLATVNEAAVTGESAPVLREAGTDRSSVIGGTKVLSDEIVIEISAEPGGSFLDRMIALVEGANRQKTPNEIALTMLLAAMTLTFLIVVATLPFIAGFVGAKLDPLLLIALLVCLIPTTIGGLLPAIGIAGMNRALSANVLAKSGKAVEIAGDIDVLLLDKTGTITFGNRMADAFMPLGGVTEQQLAEAAYLASLSDETPEGKSIVDLAGKKFPLRADAAAGASFVPFTAQTRMSGADLKDGTAIRKGASDAMLRHVGQAASQELDRIVRTIAASGGTPLVVAEDTRILGVIHLKDVVKPGIRQRFDELRKMGIRTVMVTGDNPLTAAAIAAEAGVDDFLAEATPENKLELIRAQQAEGRLVAMCGDGSNDAPALAQADVGVAMNSGTPAAKEAGNLVDLDSDPTKLIEIVLVGKQLLISRGALTTFSIANDVAKYFAILPALFVAAYPGLGLLNLMGLASPQSAILSAIIFNALIIVALIPLALRGVQYRPSSAAALLRRNLLLYGVGGLIVPFVGIKLIGVIVTATGLA